MKRGFVVTYQIAAWLFVIGVVVQVFLAGLVVVARQPGGLFMLVLVIFSAFPCSSYSS